MADLQFRALHSALQKELRVEHMTRMREGIWKDLVHSRIVDHVREGRMSVADLAQVYLRKQEDLFPPRVPRREVLREVADEGARARALSEVLARALCGICGVDAFRAQVLGGKLLSLSELASWVKDQAAREGPVSPQYVTIPAPFGERLEWLVTGDVAIYAAWLAERARRVAHDAESELPVPVTTGSLVLHYGRRLPEEGQIQIRGDGVLAQLKEVVSGIKGIARFTGWSERAAVSFVLCGVVPTLPRASVAVSYGAYPAAARVELTLSTNMSPKEVAALYQEARQSQREVLERAMDDKHLALALLADEAIGSDLTWKELRRRWNRSHPEWRYLAAKDPDARRFATRARRAWSQVTGESWRDLRFLMRTGTAVRRHRADMRRPGERPSAAGLAITPIR